MITSDRGENDMASSLPTKLRHNLTCVMCMQLFNHANRVPKMLPCQHSFCLECLEQYIEKKLDNQQIPCPVCREPYCLPGEGIIAIPDNVLAKEFVTPDGADSMPAMGEVNRCDDHPDYECIFVCQTCKVGVCSKCIIASTLQESRHGKHQLHEINDTICDVKKYVVEKMEKIEGIVTAVKN